MTANNAQPFSAFAVTAETKPTTIKSVDAFADFSAAFTTNPGNNTAQGNFTTASAVQQQFAAFESANTLSAKNTSVNQTGASNAPKPNPFADLVSLDPISLSGKGKSNTTNGPTLDMLNNNKWRS